MTTTSISGRASSVVEVRERLRDAVALRERVQPASRRCRSTRVSAKRSGRCARPSRDVPVRNPSAADDRDVQAFMVMLVPVPHGASVAGKFRRPLFHERRQAFGAVGRAHDCAGSRTRSNARPFSNVAPTATAMQALDERTANGARLAMTSAISTRAATVSFGLAHLDRVSDAERGLGVDRIAGHDHVGGEVRPDLARQALGSAVARHARRS